jgi:hypothetical protein
MGGVTEDNFRPVGDKREFPADVSAGVQVSSMAQTRR